MRHWLAAHRQGLLLGLILAAGAALRLYGLEWDGGHWLHPDERQIYFVALDLGWPGSLSEALSAASPLNPGFFAYGSLPIYLLRLVAGLLAPLSPLLRDPDNLHLVGRPLAALFDLGTVFLTYRLVRVLGKLNGPALLAASLVAFAVLHVQLTHFFTADTLLTFFVLLALNLAADVAQGAGRHRQIALGVAVGLALATKVSAFPLLLLIPVAFRLQRSAVSTHPCPERSRRDAPRTTQYLLPPALTLVATGLTFFLTQPYALLDFSTFLADTLRESQIAWGTLDVPYTRQYAGTLPYLYSLWQVALWGLGLPLGLAAWAGFAAALVRWLRRGARSDALLLAWAGPYFALVGLLHARYPRYLLPLVPVLCIMTVQLLSRRLCQRILGIGYWVLLICSFAYSLLFVRIYAEPHSWIAASRWIYDRVPAGSTLAVEDWDTALPLPLDVDGQARRIEEYDVRLLTLYAEPDDEAKWSALAGELAAADYVVIASRRGYGALTSLPERYPWTTSYYDQLFAGDLGFELAGEFTRGPAWLSPRLAPLPGAALAWLRPDESFVVYDHPRALILRNAERLPAAEILRRVSD